MLDKVNYKSAAAVVEQLEEQFKEDEREVNHKSRGHKSRRSPR